MLQCPVLRYGFTVSVFVGGPSARLSLRLTEDSLLRRTQAPEEADPADLWAFFNKLLLVLWEAGLHNAQVRNINNKPISICHLFF